MPTGHGSSLGAALADALGLRTDGPLTSYTAKGWHAQISKLTSSPRGYAAASAAGLDVSVDTLRRWLSETQAPSPANQDRIRAAYARMAGRFPTHLTGRTFRISGTVAIGRDVRDRGTGGHAPLLIDGDAGDWSDIVETYDNDELDDDQLEHLFIESIIMEDLDFSQDPGFPGGSYSVSV